MIGCLRGKIIKKHPTKLLLEVSGVGYEVHISLNTYDKLPCAGKEAFLFIHHYFRDDLQMLFGFFNEEEREVFRLLIQVNRVGPRLALSVLSHMRAEDFKNCIVAEDIGSISSISGVGKRTAERIVMELKEKIPKMGMLSITAGKSAQKEQTILIDAINALESLGFKRNLSYKTCSEILNEKSYGLEELIRIALRRMS